MRNNLFQISSTVAQSPKATTRSIIHSVNLEVRYDLNKGKYHAMRESIAEIDWIGILQCTFNVDQCWKILKGVIVEKMEKYIPTVKMS